MYDNVKVENAIFKTRSKLEHCGKCGASLSGYAPDGLCAACLLESAFEERDAGTDERSTPAPLLSFNDYELLEEIARGGMGVVYRARQVSLNRIVAIKMILGGHLANSAEMQRFRAEAETAAQLQHPNIVAIHEVGEHAGQPYFSMDLVEGRNLAQLVRDEPLPSRKAAGYLKTIAEAVQYAHSRGVLHRDLKPSNILIDDSDQPRITDFGLAKRFTSDSQLSTNDPHLTQTGQVLGSPSFIPPEQAAGGKGATGPASDVYSLGAILYHCLTARPPFVAETMTATLRMVAENEAVSPRLLNASVPRDLETICLKCLEKDSKRRYAAAQELADELGRFLRGEPIRARPASQAEKLRRWSQRKPALATAIFLSIVVAVGSPMAAFRINRERLQAEANEKKAQTEAKKSLETARFLTSMLEGVGPSAALGRDTKMLREILEKTAARVSKELTNQPEVEAGLRFIIGKTYLELGDYTNALAMTQESLRLREACFGPKHISVAEALNNLGVILSELGDMAAAEAYDRAALELKKELLGDENLNVALSLNNVGLRLGRRGDLAGAEEKHLEALRIRKKLLSEDHPDVGSSLNNLAMVHWARGDVDRAESLFREALVVFRSALGDENVPVATQLNNLGTVLRDLGRLDEAEAMKRDALAMRQKLLGNRNPYVPYSQKELAVVLQRQGKLDEAESLHRNALARLQELLGTNHQWVAESLGSLAIVLARKGEMAAAEAMQRDALATTERAVGKDSVDAADSLDRLATLRAAQGDLAGAEIMLTNALAMMKRSAGNEHPDVIPSLWQLAWVLKQRGDLAAAESLYREARTISLKGGDYSVRTLTDSICDLADLLQVQGKFTEAEPLLREASEYVQENGGASRQIQRRTFQRLALFYEAWDRSDPNSGKAGQAADWRNKLEELEQQATPKQL